MKIYQLTPVGKNVARNVNNPDTSRWRVIHTLSQIQVGTADQIALHSGLSEAEASTALGMLRRKGIVTES